ncbi:hypothetical protein GCM10025762_00970 [Haloechinothrix salitolerans]
MIDHRERLVWVTSAGNARDHAVLAATVAAGSRASAEIVAECGTRFWPAPLVADPGPQCPRCIRQPRDHRNGGRVRHPVRQREGVIGRWLTAVTRAAQHTTATAAPNRPADQTTSSTDTVVHR